MAIGLALDRLDAEVVHPPRDGSAERRTPRRPRAVDVSKSFESQGFMLRRSETPNLACAYPTRIATLETIIDPTSRQ
jgi:hypothetical protein